MLTFCNVGKGFVFVVLVFILMAFFLGGLSNYSLSFSEVYDLPGSSIGAVVVLTGGKGRLSKGVELFSQQGGSLLIISGVEANNSVEAIFTAEELSHIDRDKVYLEKQSKSTHENALNVQRILKEYRFTSIVLVTSNYHMKRALYVFQKILPDNVEIFPYAIESGNFQAATWYFSITSLRVATEEFFKYWWYRIHLQ
jgi:uncharacterized SAM-binding protein YcdF (DUF218 family)